MLINSPNISGSLNVSGNTVITGSLTTSIAALNTPATTFLTSNNGTIRSRTAAQTLSDIGGQATGSYVTIATASGSYVTIATDQSITGVKTFTKDVIVNGINIGLGAGNIDTNTRVGTAALLSNTTGFFNVALGRNASTSNTTGNSNTSLGYNALYSGATASFNTAVGALALESITGGGNVAVGNAAGRLTTANAINTTSTNSIYIGNDSSPSASGNTNEIIIGHGADGSGSNTVTIGNSSITDNYLKGNVRATTFYIAAAGTASPTIIRNTSGTTGSTGGHNTIGFNSNNNIFVDTTNSGGFILSFNNSVANRTYNLKDASGTLAFTSDIPTVAGSYLPLTGGGAITGSLIVTGGITGNVTGSATSASYVEYSNVANKPTLVSGSVQIRDFGIFATTGSNQFNGSQSITGSLTVSGQVIAQTLNVQQVTSSIVFSSGSNRFGNNTGNTHQFTGSVGVTGSLSVNGASSFSSNVTATGNLNLQGAVTRNINFYDSSNTNINAQIQYDQISSTSGQLFFGTNNAGTFATRLTISNTGAATFSGNLKIITPALGTNKLTFGVAGTDYYTLEYNDTTGNINYQSKYSHIFSGGAAGTTTILTLANTGEATFSSSVTATSGNFTVDGVATNSVLDILTLSHTTSGTAASGLGAGILFKSERPSGGVNLSRAAIYGIAGSNPDDDGDLTFYTRTDTSGAGFTEKMRITSDGNVGIGLNSPPARLSLVGGSTMQFGIDGNSGNNLIYLRGGTTGDKAAITLNHYGYADFHIAVGYTANTVLSLTKTISGTDGIIINSSGYVGIGNADPPSLLSMNTSSATAYDATVDDGQAASGSTLTIRNGNTTTNSFAQVNMQVSGDSGRALARIVGICMASATSDIAFVTENANVKSEKVRINSSGDLIVKGSVANISLLGDGVQMHFSRNNTNYIIANGGTSATIRIISNTNGVELSNGATSWVAVSDENLKVMTEWKPFENSIEKILSLRAGTSRYKTDEEGTSRSFIIAQDVEKVLPEAVSAYEDGTLGLRYTEVIPLLIASIQELKAENDTLKSRIDTLEQA